MTEQTTARPHGETVPHAWAVDDRRAAVARIVDDVLGSTRGLCRTHGKLDAVRCVGPGRPRNATRPTGRPIRRIIDPER
jgi:hypothetical protein